MAPKKIKKEKFSPLRNFIWPIHSFEIKKFLPMSLMMFCVLFNYTILRNTKDALVVTSSGAEVIPFLKGFIILPIAFIFATIYAKITNIFNQESIFYCGISMFMIIFWSFNLYLYPNREFLEPDPEIINNLKTKLPWFKHFFSAWEHWVFSIFYLFAELWGTIVLFLLFWRFANEVTTTKEAKRFYPMYVLIAHFALIAAGGIAKHFCSLQNNPLPNVDSCQDFLQLINWAFTGSCFIIIGLCYWMNRNVLTDPIYYKPLFSKARKKEKKIKFTFKESLNHIVRSRYIGLISILVIGYGAANNIMGIMWKNQLKEQYTDAISYSNFMGTFSFVTGIVTIFFIFFFKGIIPRFGWHKAALITPMVLLTTSTTFFIFIIFGEKLSCLTLFMGTTPVFATVIIGTAQQILSKSSKYSMFDPTKEMAYIPLDEDLKNKGKAAVDLIGHSFAKASGGYIISALLIITAGTLSDIVPILSIIVVSIIMVWIVAIKKLATKYSSLVKKREKEQIYND